MLLGVSHQLFDPFLKRLVLVRNIVDGCCHPLCGHDYQVPVSVDVKRIYTPRHACSMFLRAVLENAIVTGDDRLGRSCVEMILR